MNNDSPTNLSSYINGLHSSGRVVFAAEEAERALGIGHGAFLDAAERQQRRKTLLSPRRGFYVLVPPQYAAWEAPPPTWYIDQLMRHEGAAYYVGLLKAAELHGATHQAIMEFQVVAAKRLASIRSGRSLVKFYFRKNLEAVEDGMEDYKTDTGAMKISSAALTALDLLRYPQASGGIDNVATVLADLGKKIDPEQLASLSRLVEKPVVQRLGYLLEYSNHDSLAKPLLEALRSRGFSPWTELDRQESRDPDTASEPLQRDQRWRVIVRRLPQADA